MSDIISGIAGITPQAQEQAKTAQASSKDYDMFLRLLTTQMKNQDPTAPMDPTQFVSQIATFTQVEQLTQANSRIGELTQLFAGSLSRLDIGYIGMDVEAKVEGFKFDGNDVDFRYATNGADDVEIVILDVAGEVVRTQRGETAAGEQRFSWDGTGDAGSLLAEGDYRIEVRATDQNGNELPSVVSMRGIVDEVITENGLSILLFQNGTAVDSANVVGIKRQTVVGV